MSFSFTMGTTPMDKSSLNVFTALRYLVRYMSLPMNGCSPNTLRSSTHVGNITTREQNLSYRLSELSEEVVP